MATLGMIGTGDWATDERPLNWRDMILMLEPNGMAPLTAMTAKLGSESVNDPQYHWWTKTLSRQGGTVANVFIDTALGEAYVRAEDQAVYGIAGGTVHCQVAAAVAGLFREGHEVCLRDADRPFVDVIGRVSSIDIHGSSSRISVVLHEADDNDTTTASYNLATVDTILVAGNVNAEGGEIPDALHFDPTKVYNYTQIFRTPLEISGTAKNTKLRTGDAYQEMKRETLQYHSIEMEKAFLRGVRYEGTGSNGKNLRSTQGIITGLRANASANCVHYPDTSGYTTKTWKVGGMDWLHTQLEILSRYGGPERLAFCGNGALLGLNQLAETYGNINIVPRQLDYGIKVVTWVTPFVEINFKSHPLMTLETTDRYAVLLFEPNKLKYRFIQNRDTNFYPDINRDKKYAGFTKIDGIKEEFLTEGGIEQHHFQTGAFYTGFGSDGRSAA